MGKFKSLAAFAAGLLLASAASAGVVCNNCSYNQLQPATYLGLHNPTQDDNSTFGNATTGQNGDFSNWWVFDINPAGTASVNAIFLPIANISNFDVKLYSATATCGGLGSVCNPFTSGALLADGFTNPAYATVIDFTDLAVGRYAFNITGTISGLTATQPASYTGNLQVNEATVPEPATLAIAGLGLLGVAFTRRKKA